ncbi:retrovirus-related pol polyprotein from transposon TNT 1-94 [Tanacetum coccineum]
MWLFCHKYLADGTLSRYKAHLVANGSTHVSDIDVDDTFSPVVKLGTIRIVLSLATSQYWPIYQLDVKNVFLHGDLSETVYMHQPLGHETYTAYLLLYVDDIVLTASSKTLLLQIIRSLHHDFSMTDLGSLNYFLGISVKRDSKGMFLSWRNLAGSLQYLTFTRLNISNAVQQVCLYMHDPREPHFSALKRILRTYSLGPPKLHTPLSPATLVYCDNVSAVCLSFNLVQHQRTKHIEIDIHFVRDLVAAGQNHVFHERTKNINVRYHFIREVLEAKTVKVLKANIKPKVEIVRFSLYFSISPRCEAALEVLPADMEAQAKAELNKKAHSAMILCLGNKVFREVIGETTAAGVWSKLETLYMTKSLANKLYLKNKLYTFYMPAGRKISEHIDEFNKIVPDLANMEVKFEDEYLALLLLTSLPASYQHFVDTLIYGREALTLEDIGDHVSQGGKSRSKYRRWRLEVFICQSEDHLKRNCLKNNRKKSTGYVKKDDQPSSNGLIYDGSENAMGAVYSWVTTGSVRSEVFTVKLQSDKVKVINGSSVVLSGIQRDNCVYSLDSHAVAGGTTSAGEAVSVWQEVSRRVWVYILRFKHEAFGKFKEWKQLVENQTRRTVKKLRTDNGLEFCNREFEQLCIESGIARHLTVAGTPQQNGLAERMNRTLMDKVRCLLIQSGLPKTFWAEATCTAAYLINRSPSTAIEKKTPMEMWSGHPSDYGMLRIFGCVAYPHDKQGKLEPRAIKCVLLGYPEGVKGYRLYRLDDESPKIVTSRNVVFNESVMYKDTLKDSGAGADKSVEELQVEVELQRLNNHTLEEDQTD